MQSSRHRILSVSVATLAVCLLFAALGWYLQEPGHSTSRLVFFAILGGAGVLALYGIVAERGTIAIGGIAVLSLLGFWQAVLWIVLFPVIALLLLATMIGNAETRTQSAETD